MDVILKLIDISKDRKVSSDMFFILHKYNSAWSYCYNKRYHHKYHNSSKKVVHIILIEYFYTVWYICAKWKFFMFWTISNHTNRNSNNKIKLFTLALCAIVVIISIGTSLVVYTLAQSNNDMSSKLNSDKNALQTQITQKE